MIAQLNWSRAIVAGLVAGLVFVIMEMVLVSTALGGSPWAPPRMMAAIAMGKEVLPPPASFALGIVMVGVIIHFVLSAVYGAIIALLTGKLGSGMAIAAGAIVGLVIYLVNFYGATEVFPWFANARNWVTIVSHLAFGGVAAWYYTAGVTQKAEPAP